jgi:DNA-binding protein YbaB
MRTDVQAQIGAMLEEFRATRSQVERLQAAAATLIVSVRSPDRSVTVTVDAQGELRDLRIDSIIAARLDCGALSARILGASRLAAAQAREQMRVTMREALPERLRDLVAADGSVDLAAVLPADLADLARLWAR